MTDIEKLKQAFDEWEARACEGPVSTDAHLAAKLFWPFVEYVLNEPEQSIRNIELINQLKYDLGMPLMAHEERGVKK